MRQKAQRLIHTSAVHMSTKLATNTSLSWLPYLGNHPLSWLKNTRLPTYLPSFHPACCSVTRLYPHDVRIVTPHIGGILVGRTGPSAADPLDSEGRGDLMKPLRPRTVWPWSAASYRRYGLKWAHQRLQHTKGH